MTLAREVASELKTSGIKDLGAVEAYHLPYTKPDKLNEILVTEVTTIPNNYGSNIFTEADETIQLNIFYGTEKTVPIDTFEHSIVSFFVERNWTLIPYGGHYLDPDTNQLSVVMKFKRRKEWNYKV